MLSFQRTRKTTAFLSEEQLEEMFRVCVSLRSYYIQGDEYWNEASECTLCTFTNHLYSIASTALREGKQCIFCPWYLLEGIGCNYWHANYFNPCKYSISTMRERRDPRLVELRVEMLRKWIRRIDTLLRWRRKDAALNTLNVRNAGKEGDK
jgi:hypothetical protein